MRAAAHLAPLRTAPGRMCDWNSLDEHVSVFRGIIYGGAAHFCDCVTFSQLFLHLKGMLFCC